MTGYILLALSIVLGAVGQFFFKIGSTASNSVEGGNFDFYLNIASNPSIWLGAICYGTSFFIWMKVLSIFNLSFARPLVGAGYIVTALLATIFLNEKISLIRWTGIVLIVIGIFLVARN